VKFERVSKDNGAWRSTDGVGPPREWTKSQLPMTNQGGNDQTADPGILHRFIRALLGNWRSVIRHLERRQCVVKWLGHSAFLLTASDGTRIVTGPL